MLARVVLVTPARVGEPMLDPVGLAIRGQVVVRMQAQGVRDIRGPVEQPTRVPVVTLTQALAVPVIAAQEVLVIQVQEGATVVQRFVSDWRRLLIRAPSEIRRIDTKIFMVWGDQVGFMKSLFSILTFVSVTGCAGSQLN